MWELGVVKCLEMSRGSGSAKRCSQRTVGVVRKLYLRGSETWPVISLEGSIGVLLYGIVAVKYALEEREQCERREMRLYLDDVTPELFLYWCDLCEQAQSAD